MSDHTDAILRAQAWERAKGELNSVLVTYYPDYSKSDASEEFEKADKLIRNFIRKFEDEGCAC
jgi:hypothetical protein